MILLTRCRYLLAALLLGTATCLSAQLAYWSFECGCTYHSFPIQPDYQLTGILAAGANMGAGNNNGSPDACGGNDTWGTNFWPRFSSRETNAYVEFYITAEFGYRLRVTGVTFTTSASSSSAAQFFDVYYSTNHFQTEFFLTSGTTSTGCSGSGGGLDVLITGGNTFAFRIYPYGQDPAALAATLRFDDVSIVGSTILPVEWGAFSAVPTAKGVSLYWSTTSESGNDHFAVERSSDGIAFERIGKVHGRGTTQTAQTYEFLDDRPLSGTNYYRLRQVDHDASYQFSTLQRVEVGEAGAPLLVWPNPVGEQAFLSLPNRIGEAINCRLFTSAGKLIRRFAVPAGKAKYLLSTAELPAGIYFLEWQLHGRREVVRLVK